MKKMYSRVNAFTIIELLVVIGIISILAVALLVSLNPAEAQKRARDAQRLKDINTLQAIIEQFINDGNSTVLCPTTAPCYSASVAGTSPNVCAVANWTGISFCAWAKTVPTDPSNASTRTCNTGIGTTATTCLMRYRLIFSGSNYEISTMTESSTNAAKGVNDGGAATNANSIVQIWSGSELTVNAFTVVGGSPTTY